MADNIREKLVELLSKNARCPKEVSNCHDCPYWADDVGCYEYEATADMLIANGVTVQETAHWKDVLDCGVGNCFGICSNCRTQQKAASYASLMTEYRHCRWCGAKMSYEPPKGE